MSFNGTKLVWVSAEHCPTHLIHLIFFHAWTPQDTLHAFSRVTPWGENFGQCSWTLGGHFGGTARPAEDPRSCGIPGLLWDQQFVHLMLVYQEASIKHKWSLSLSIHILVWTIQYNMNILFCIHGSCIPWPARDRLGKLHGKLGEKAASHHEDDWTACHLIGRSSHEVVWSHSKHMKWWLHMGKSMYM